MQTRNAPSGPAPVSREDLDVIIKRKAPKGPPPPTMSAFRAPKSNYGNYARNSNEVNSNNDDEDDYVDDGDYDDDYRPSNNTRNSQSNAYGGYENEEINDHHRNSDSKHRKDDRDYAEHKESKHHQDGPIMVAPRLGGPHANVSTSHSPPSRALHTSNCKLYNFGPLLKATYRELKQFALQPCEDGCVTRCYIERNKVGSNMFSPVYSLCADLEDGTGREFIICRKVMQARSSYYVFSLKQDDLYRNREQRSRLYLGKLRWVSETEYVLYDSGGIVPNDDMEPNTHHVDSGGESKSEDSLYRKELTTIHFNSYHRPLTTKHPSRGMEVCIRTVIPGVHGDSQSPHADSKAVGIHKPAMLNLLPFFRTIRESGKQNVMYRDQLLILNERTSKYDPISSCLVDFHGRANLASVKNCQLVISVPEVDSDTHSSTDTKTARSSNNNSSIPVSKFQEEDADHFILQLGKTTADCFNMDYKHPLSMFQAFAICIARFDANLHNDIFD